MAAATLNVYNVIDELRLALNDAANGLGTAGDWLSDAQYNKFIVPHIYSSETTYTLTEYATGLYKHSDGKGLYVWFTDQTTPFAGTDDTTYTVYCQGPVVHVTSGTASETSISINGCPVHFSLIVSDVFYHLATYRAKEISQNNAAGTLTVDQAAQRCLHLGEFWRGVVTSG